VRKLHKFDPYNLCSSPSVIRMYFLMNENTEKSVLEIL
jgi:hypothetical protein